MRDANFRDLYASRLISVEADCTSNSLGKLSPKGICPTHDGICCVINPRNALSSLVLSETFSKPYLARVFLFSL
jgi:hypothetical protein